MTNSRRGDAFLYGDDVRTRRGRLFYVVLLMTKKIYVSESCLIHGRRVTQNVVLFAVRIVL